MVYCSNADLSTAQHNLQINLDSGLSRLQTNQLSLNVRKSHVKLKFQNHELSIIGRGRAYSLYALKYSDSESLYGFCLTCTERAKEISLGQTLFRAGGLY